jgi:hypothetical protein
MKPKIGAKTWIGVKDWMPSRALEVVSGGSLLAVAVFRQRVLHCVLCEWSGCAFGVLFAWPQLPTTPRSAIVSMR